VQVGVPQGAQLAWSADRTSGVGKAGSPEKRARSRPGHLERQWGSATDPLRGTRLDTTVGRRTKVFCVRSGAVNLARPHGSTRRVAQRADLADGVVCTLDLQTAYFQLHFVVL
jgi:hypothetical protein